MLRRCFKCIYMVNVMNKIKLKRYVNQVDEKDCGVAALSMVISQYESDISLSRLRDIAKTTMEGTTALGIVKASESLGFETNAIKADMTLFDDKDVPLPFIAHVNKKGNILHYYVVYAYNSKNIWIADPDRSVSKRKMTYEEFSLEWTGVSIFIAPTPRYTPIIDNDKNMKSLMSIVLKQKHMIMLIVLSALLVTVISIIGSYYLELLIDKYIPYGMKNTLGVISLGLIVSYTIQQILSYGRDYLLIILSQRLSIDVILSYIKHLFELPMSFYETRRTGEITSRFGDANSIIDAVASAIITVFLDVGTLIIVGSVLFVQNYHLFLITLFSLPVYLMIVWIFKKPFENMNQDSMQSNAILNSTIIEDINGMETIKTLTSEKYKYKQVDREFVDFLNKSFIYHKTIVLQSAIKGGTKLIINVCVLWLGAYLVIKNVISVGQLITYNALLGYFTDPLQNIVDLQTKLQQAKVANNRLNEVYLVPSEFEESNSFNEVHNGDIEFQNITYKYGFNKNTLDNINLKINKGSKVSIVGMSGSGKSTLVKLLTRFLDPESGLIKINNQDITTVSKESLRRLITYVPQNPYIFTGTIEQNLLFGTHNDISYEDIIKALSIVHLTQDIVKLPQGLKTEISIDSGLSGGQKQRIAIARALLTNSPILILDESTSALDLLTEKEIINALISSNKTIIFVAHRLSIAEKSDNILVVGDGHIIDSGSHDELIKRDGLYSELVNH